MSEATNEALTIAPFLRSMKHRTCKALKIIDLGTNEVLGAAFLVRDPAIARIFMAVLAEFSEISDEIGTVFVYHPSSHQSSAATPTPTATVMPSIPPAPSGPASGVRSDQA